MLPELPTNDDMRISTRRLDLVPLTAADADDLFPLLNDPQLGRFTGDTPPADVEAVRAGFARWEARRSPNGAELWLNWVLRVSDDARPIGLVQATVGDGDAAIAWTVGTDFQRQGFATEAGHALIVWLHDTLGVPLIVGSIHPDNIASQTAAHRIGLRPTDRRSEGEVVWEYVPPNESGSGLSQNRAWQTPPVDSHRQSPWVVRSRRTAYENPWMTVWHDEVIRPDGSDGVYGIVHFSTAGVWIAATEDDRVLLVGQHRHPLGGAWSWELPAGKVMLDETPLDGAKRELAEETGYRADHWRELTRFDLAPGVSDLHGVCFEASGLGPGTATPDDIEDIRTRWVGFDEALALVDEGEISDAITQMSLFRIALERRRRLPT